MVKIGQKRLNLLEILNKFFIIFWVIILLNIANSKLSLRPLFQSIKHEKIHKCTQRSRCLWNIDFGCSVKRSHTEITKDNVKSL